MTPEPLPDLHLTAGPDHRLQEQLEFLRMFPGYAAETTGCRVTLRYRTDRAVGQLTMAPTASGVTVRGDPSVARRVFNVTAAPLLPATVLPARPAAHRMLHRRLAGIRPVRFAATFEGIAWAILGQQVTVNAASRLKNNLARHYGPQVMGASGPVWVFPGPADLAEASVDALRSLQLSRQKAEALLSVARAIASGRWHPEQTFREPTAIAVEDLRRFRGVGRWTAEYVLLRVAGHPDVLPVGDAALQRAWARLNGLPGRVDERTLQEAGAAWSGWRSDFAFCLWLDQLATRRSSAGEGAKSRGALGAAGRRVDAEPKTGSYMGCGSGGG